jgi:uncharacterized membrane protein
MKLLSLPLLPDWAPNIHPMLVHFPIALFFFAVLMDFLSFFLPEGWWGEKKTVIIYVIGAISVVVVYFTGKMAAGTLHNISNVEQQAVEHHMQWGLRTMWFFVIYTLIRLALVFTKRMQKLNLHVVMFLISLIGIFFLFETGDHGAKLVFKYEVNAGHAKKKNSSLLRKPSQTRFDL